MQSNSVVLTLKTLYLKSKKKNILWLKRLKHKLSAISLKPLTNESVGARMKIYTKMGGRKIIKLEYKRSVKKAKR